MPDQPLVDDLRLAHVLADAADSITTSRFRATDLVVTSKPDLTPVTDADTAVEDAIRSMLGHDVAGVRIGKQERLREDLLRILSANTGMSEDEAYFFHLEMWVYVHGIATMIATDYLDWDEELISRMLTDAYEGMKERYKK